MAMRRINLLPPELLQRRRSRQTIAALGAAGLALIALLAIVYLSQEFRLRGERGNLERQEDVNADLQAEVAQLSEFGGLVEELESREELLEDLTSDEVRWSVLLADVSLVVPSDVWLTNFTGSVSLGVDQEEEGSVLGTIQMDGTTFDHPDVARWLTRLDGVDAFLIPYISLSTRTQIANVQVVDFNSSVQLSPLAFRRNQPGGQRDLR